MDAFPNLTILDHPLIRHKLTMLRERSTPKKLFRELVEEISMLMAYEATRDLPIESHEIETPLEATMQWRLGGKKLVVVPILRAGLGMAEGVIRLLPSARVGHIGLQRDHETLLPSDYYFRIPAEPEARDFLVLDPMLATGGSASAAIRALEAGGARRIRLLCLVAAPEGVALLRDRHPEVHIFTAALDRELDGNGYIRPGLGDAGDRLFGTK